MPKLFKLVSQPEIYAGCCEGSSASVCEQEESMQYLGCASSSPQQNAEPKAPFAYHCLFALTILNLNRRATQ